MKPIPRLPPVTRIFFPVTLNKEDTADMVCAEMVLFIRLIGGKEPKALLENDSNGTLYKKVTLECGYAS
jgi:hypothetical protein